MSASAAASGSPGHHGGLVGVQRVQRHPLRVDGDEARCLFPCLPLPYDDAGQFADAAVRLGGPKPVLAVHHRVLGRVAAWRRANDQRAEFGPVEVRSDVVDVLGRGVRLHRALVLGRDVKLGEL